MTRLQAYFKTLDLFLEEPDPAVTRFVPVGVKLSNDFRTKNFGPITEIELEQLINDLVLRWNMRFPDSENLTFPNTDHPQLEVRSLFWGFFLSMIWQAQTSYSHGKGREDLKKQIKERKQVVKWLTASSEALLHLPHKRTYDQYFLHPYHPAIDPHAKLSKADLSQETSGVVELSFHQVFEHNIVGLEESISYFESMLEKEKNIASYKTDSLGIRLAVGACSERFNELFETPLYGTTAKLVTLAINETVSIEDAREYLRNR